MLPRTSELLILLTVLSASSAALICHAQQVQSPATVRYHFGDDPNGKLGWANPSFDDSAWPSAKDDRWPIPPLDSDGFVWVRFQIPVRSDAHGPLAIRVSDPNSSLSSFEVFTDGRSVAQQGSFPPNPEPVLAPWEGLVVELPEGLAKPQSSRTGCGFNPPTGGPM